MTSKKAHPFLRIAIGLALAVGFLGAVAGESTPILVVQVIVGAVVWGFLIAWLRGD